ncbi:MAG: Ig-like domain-containing protein [Clostridiales bacterium]|nr:Ig-like domain-containing protein [Clostridiales bacterium]
MKRVGTILSLLIIIVLLGTTFSFASDFTLVSTFPEEGSNKVHPTNVVIKLVFSENITSEEAQEANKDCFLITDSDRNVIDHTPLYNPEKYPNEVWLRINDTLVPDMEYKLVISETVRSSEGNTLDESIVLNFSTRDTSSYNSGYMILMILMVVGMIAFSVWEARKKEKKEDITEKKINPYKEAKRTGKSVEEIVEKIEKEKAKAEKRREKEMVREEKTEPEREGVYRVKVRRPIADAGVATPKSVIEQKKARQEAERRKEEEKKNAKRSPQQRKSKGKQRQKKRKK